MTCRRRMVWKLVCNIVLTKKAKSKKQRYHQHSARSFIVLKCVSKTFVPALRLLWHRQEKGPQYKKFKEGCFEETGILQEEPLSYCNSRSLIVQKKCPKRFLVWQHMAIVKSSYLLSISEVIILQKRRKQALLPSHLLCIQG